MAHKLHQIKIIIIFFEILARKVALEMGIRKNTDLKDLLKDRERLLALDVGEKTIGIAVSDAGLSIASPVKIIRRTKFTQDMREIAKICEDYPIGAFIVGLPVNMDGSEGPRCQSIKDFTKNMMSQTEIFGQELEVCFWDERLSTVAVDRLMIEADLSRKRRKEVVDKMAATYFLQGLLDSLSDVPPLPPFPSDW